jgi:SAM-dependent methyltransferase
VLDHERGGDERRGCAGFDEGNCGIVSSSWQAFERAGWDTCVDPYHRFFAPISEGLAPVLLEWARVGAGTDVLDLCCGPGYVAGAAAALGARPRGVDISAGMVDLARRLVPDSEFAIADAEELPYPDRSFDAVVCNFGLHHLPRADRAVAECGRVLRGGGRFVTSVWDEDVNDLAIVPEAVYGAGAVVPAEIPAPPPQPSYLDDDDVAALLAGSGLTLAGRDVAELPAVFSSADELWNGWLAAAIRTGPVLAAQDRETKQRAREAFDRAASGLAAPDGSVRARIRVVVLIAERRELNT